MKYDLCVIGAGSGGLSVAAGASQMGANVVLIEKNKMGGDCLNYGCVPSKALLAAAKHAKCLRASNQFGINAENITIDFKKVHQHIHDVIKTIAPNDSAERFEKMGVKVIKGIGRFVDAKTLEVNNELIRARRFVIATGASAAIPPIDGLDKINYLTNETIFDLTELPKDLIIIGGGPIACEMAQAHCLLGANVSVIVRSKILSKDEPACVDVVRKQFIKDGINLFEETAIQNITSEKNNITINFKHQNKNISINGSHILVATGRKTNIEELNLENANIKYSKKGVIVDKKLRTTNKKIFTVGDAIGSYQFTHIANYHAGIVIRNTLFHLPAKVDYSAIPWCTYTEPELAHAGLTEEQARKQHNNIKILTKSFAANDRAQTGKNTGGLIKVITTKKGYVLGVSIVGHNAGELIMPWSLIITKKMKMSSITDLIVPYPTISEISKSAASEFFTPLLYSKRMKKLVRFLQIFNW